MFSILFLCRSCCSSNFRCKISVKGTKCWKSVLTFTIFRCNRQSYFMRQSFFLNFSFSFLAVMYFLSFVLYSYSIFYSTKCVMCIGMSLHIRKKWLNNLLFSNFLGGIGQLWIQQEKFGTPARPRWPRRSRPMMTSLTLMSLLTMTLPTRMRPAPSSRR